MANHDQIKYDLGQGPEILSPEGVEEKLMFETTFQITMTAGGKYRVYMVEDGQRNSVNLLDDLDSAKKFVARGMITLGGMILDPEAMLKAILGGLQDKPHG